MATLAQRSAEAQRIAARRAAAQDLLLDVKSVFLNRPARVSGRGAKGCAANEVRRRGVAAGDVLPQEIDATGWAQRRWRHWKLLFSARVFTTFLLQNFPCIHQLATPRY